MTTTLEAIEQQIKTGELDQAEKALQAIQQTDGESIDVAYLKGYLRERQFDREGALQAYSHVLDRDPDHRDAAFHAAVICDQGGDELQAIELYERCLDIEPVPVSVLINLAVLYEEEGRLRDAERLLKAVLEEHPNHVRARQFLKSVQSSFNMIFDEVSQRDREKRNAVLDTPISDFELSVRSRNCLRQMDIHTLGDLLRTTEAELLSYKNFGETSLNEVKSLLAQRGLRLGQALKQPVVDDAPAFLQHANPFGISPPAPEAPQAEPANDLSVHARRPISDLELSVRSRKALQRLGATTLGELAVHSEAELMAVKNFGQTSLNEIKRQLALYGLSLRASRS
jgi:DNA-directed RNA polymerase subunit alpha